MKTRTQWPLLVVVFGLIALGVSLRGVQSQKQVSRVAWEYTTLLIPYNDSDKLIPLINTQGAAGWEVIQTKFPEGDDKKSSVIFVLLKRPK